MQKSYFENYIQQLGKQDQKRFIKVLDEYPNDLKPRHFINVKTSIENNKKLSDTAKTQMLKFNDYIFEEMFSSKEFIKEYQGFKIGDDVFVDDSKHKRTISEFVETEDGILVIFTDYSILNPPNMIEMISKEKRQDSNGEPYFYKLKEYSIFDDLHITEITSDVRGMLNEYTSNVYEFNPEYQRDLVWSTEQKQAFIKALMIGDVDLCPTLIAEPYSKSHRKREYEVLDGKQRMMAVIEYIRGKFSVEGFYYKDLTLGDVSRLMHSPFRYRLVKYYDKQKGFSKMTIEQKVELFLQINEYGQRVSEEHLAKIKSKYLK